MARIRNIKPEFFLDETVQELTMEGRLFFVGLWTQMDRLGVCPYRPAVLKGQIFPYDDQINAQFIVNLVNDLRRLGLLRLFTFQNKKFLFCPGFQKHQILSTSEKRKTSVNGLSTENLPTSDEGQDNDCPSVDKKHDDLGHRTYDIGQPFTTNVVTATTVATFAKHIQEIWNAEAKSFPKVEKLSAKRLAALKRFHSEEPDTEYWRNVILRMEASPFLKGETLNSSWRATFDFFLKPDTHIKTMEGQYDGKSQTPQYIRNEEWGPVLIGGDTSA